MRRKFSAVRERCPPENHSLFATRCRFNIHHSLFAIRRRFGSAGALPSQIVHFRTFKCT
jgi:hypothetical protein